MPCYKLLTACSKLVTTTRNKQWEHNLSTACEEICNNLFADLQQLMPFYVCGLNFQQTENCQAVQLQRMFKNRHARRTCICAKEFHLNLEVTIQPAASYLVNCRLYSD